MKRGFAGLDAGRGGGGGGGGGEDNVEAADPLTNFLANASKTNHAGGGGETGADDVLPVRLDVLPVRLDALVSEEEEPKEQVVPPLQSLAALTSSAVIDGDPFTQAPPIINLVAEIMFLLKVV